jgi:flagella basal body P-ring formation protein FlgA
MIGNGKRLLIILVAVAAGATILPGAALAAKPRPSVSIEASTVKLSDLFSGLEPGQDCEIGPAPAPGARIVVEQPQLAAIATQFGVEWQPDGLPAQVVISRRGRLMAREELLPLIRSALVAAGAPVNSDVALSTRAALMLPAEVTSRPDIDSLDYDRGSGRFTAQLLFDVPGGEPLRMQIAGTAQEMIDLPVLSHSMGAGSVIAPSDLQIRRLRKGFVGDRTLLAVEDGVGLALRHRTGAGNPVSLDELSRPLLVSRGMPVVLRLEGTGLLLTAKGEAIEGGALDDRIHVLNPASRAVLIARVTAPGVVQVDPASTPVLLGPQQSGLPPPYSLAAMTQPTIQQGSAQ